ncbi:MAG: MaoC family dehydratase [Bacteroidales bacterium]
MSLLIINSYDEFATFIGKELGVSDYLKITQEQINKFAEATLDYQWIHLDRERAEKESPFKTTIAHGYLNVSVMPYLWGQIVEFRNIKLMVNYGIEKLKFNQAVLVDNEVRVRAKLLDLQNLRGITKAQLHITLEIKDNPKPALEGVIIFLYHFR